MNRTKYGKHLLGFHLFILPLTTFTKFTILYGFKCIIKPKGIHCTYMPVQIAIVQTDSHYNLSGIGLKWVRVGSYCSWCVTHSLLLMGNFPLGRIKNSIGTWSPLCVCLHPAVWLLLWLEFKSKLRCVKRITNNNAKIHIHAHSLII